MTTSEILNKIDRELATAITQSNWDDIDYDYSLQNNPTLIRTKEQQLAQDHQESSLPSEMEIKNIFIPSRDSDRKIRLRSYRPNNQEDLPIFLYFHGGAFIFGTPEQYDTILANLALDANILIVSVDYRLAPEHPFPAAVYDGYDSLEWLSLYANKIGGQNNKIIIGGSSAGGTIAASITQYNKKINIVHQFLLYPAMNSLLTSDSMQLFANAPMQTKTSAYWMWHHYLQGNLTTPPPFAVPSTTKDLTNLPSATIITAEYDPLRDEAHEYSILLKNSHVDVNYLCIKGAVHAFDFFTSSLSTQFHYLQVNLLKNIIQE
ncbi:alpha/beta hydrolase [Myroides injenensis]|uniref:alpha/beta hydrolase n=1 Tax=Myroides injenensis TaxID=1183151 RepID=UPI000288388A|nr:alpha/beta hydrolase [Myroides injenensis]